jgi:hypothetical protein
MPRSDWSGWTPEPPPKLEPLFPIDSYIPASPCPHHGPIRKGSTFVCMVCHRSGQDHRTLPGEPIDTSTGTTADEISRRAAKQRTRRATANARATKQGA